MTNKLRTFFNNNDVRIGAKKDYTTNPPTYYSSLDDAFRNYFLSARDKMETFHFILDITSWSRQSLAFNFIGSTDYIAFSILSFHRFFELLLKDILRRINPFLAVKFIEKENELFNYLDNNITADEIKTIEYGETIKRFKQAFTHYSKATSIYKEHLECYEFLKDKRSEETLQHLGEWRNRIMHNGTTFPNLFAYEYLITQRIIPLINNVIEAEKKYLKDYLPHFYKTVTGIKIIEQILSVNFEFTDFGNQKKSKELAIKLFKLAHIKEIGRSTFNINIYLNQNFAIYEPKYNNPIGRIERFAETEKTHPNFYNLINCICCGTKSLIVYRVILDNKFSNHKFSSWAKCFNCDYLIKNNIGDPHLFNLSKELIFPIE